MLWHVKLLLKKRDLLYKVEDEIEAGTKAKLKMLSSSSRNSSSQGQRSSIRSRSLFLGSQKSFKEEAKQSNLLSVAELFEEDDQSAHSKRMWKTETERQQEQRREDKAKIRANFDSKIKSVGKC